MGTHVATGVVGHVDGIAACSLQDKGKVMGKSKVWKTELGLILGEGLEYKAGFREALQFGITSNWSEREESLSSKSIDSGYQCYGGVTCKLRGFCV